jgi:hypothetical protein
VQRRILCIALAGVAVGLATGLYPARSSAQQPTYKVSARQIQAMLAQRFPLRYEVAGFIDLNIQQPQLRFMPAANRLGGEFIIETSGPALRRAYAGQVDLDFALRYEPRDMSIRAHGIRVHSVRVPGLPRDAAALIDVYARESAEAALVEVIVHQLRSADLAVSDAMGLEPGAITVMPDAVLIGFVPRQPR